MKLLKIWLNLFDGGDAAGAAPAGEGAAQGETTAPGNTRRGKSGEFANVVFGKQEVTNAQEGPAAGDVNTGVKTTSDALDEKRRAFQELVQGEYKDQYTEATQRIIDRRFAETKNLQNRLDATQPLVDMLAERYSITDGDISKIMKAIDNDSAFLADAAEEAGMTVEQYKSYSRMKRENEAFRNAQLESQNRRLADAQVQKWIMEADAVKQKFPDFDLQAEANNPQFVNLLKSGVPVEHAYKVLHYDAMMTTAMQTAAAQTEQAVVNNVRARGTRPAENGTASQSAFTVKDDVSKLTRKERAEIAKRVARGEKITF